MFRGCSQQLGPEAGPEIRRKRPTAGNDREPRMKRQWKGEAMESRWNFPSEKRTRSEFALQWSNCVKNSLSVESFFCVLFLPMSDEVLVYRAPGQRNPEPTLSHSVNNPGLTDWLGGGREGRSLHGWACHPPLKPIVVAPFLPGNQSSQKDRYKSHRFDLSTCSLSNLQSLHSNGVPPLDQKPEPKLCCRINGVWSGSVSWPFR